MDSIKIPVSLASDYSEMYIRHRNPYTPGKLTIVLKEGTNEELILLSENSVTALREALDVLTKDRRIQDRRKS